MKQQTHLPTTLKKARARRIALSTVVLLALASSAQAQDNTSYKTNSTPINGWNNCGFGVGALTSGLAGSYGNVAAGVNSLHLLTTGSFNTAAGTGSLYSNTTGQANTAVGMHALTSNTTGNDNVANGNSALYSNTTSHGLVGIGAYALYSNTTGTDNTATGYKAMYANTIGDFNTAYGFSALSSNAAGGYNLANGYKALSANTNGHNNVAVGSQALRNNTSGSSNVAVGINALVNNTTAGSNTAIGSSSMLTNTTGANNTASGSSSLYSNSTGNDNVANGYRALFSNTTGFANLATGSNAMNANTTGALNTAVGPSALTANTTGNRNVALGYEALNSSNAEHNTATGYRSMYLNTTGVSNSACGIGALYSNTTGNYNTGTGGFAGVSTGALTNATGVGYGALANASNKVRIGNASVTVIEGQVAYSYPSDARFKTNVKEEDVKGLAFIQKLRPVVYNFDTRKFTEFQVKNMPDSIRRHYLDRDFTASTKIRQSGFIAQEVEQAAKDAQYDFNGVHAPANAEEENYSIAYSEFVVPLVKGMQEQQKMIEGQDQKIENQKQMIEDQKQAIALLQQQVNDLLENLKPTTGLGQDPMTAASMEQNVPNPFSHETVIKFNLPQQVANASMNVYDLSGKQLKSLPINQRGAASITITADQLAAGMYIYSIVADGKILNSKRMVIAGK